MSGRWDRWENSGGGCALGDDPGERELFRHEPDDDRPTLGQLLREEHEPLTAWPPPHATDGSGQ